MRHINEEEAYYAITLTYTYTLHHNNLLFHAISFLFWAEIWYFKHFRSMCIFCVTRREQLLTGNTGPIKLHFSCKKKSFEWSVRLTVECLPDIDVHILLRNCTHTESHLGLERPQQNQFLCHISCSPSSDSSCDIMVESHFAVPVIVRHLWSTLWKKKYELQCIFFEYPNSNGWKLI